MAAVDGNASNHEFWSVSTTHILQRLAVFAVNTGTWTAIFALLSAIMVRVIRWWHVCLQHFLIQKR